MNQPATYTTWRITCASREETQVLKQWLSGLIYLDRVLIDTQRVAPSGNEQVQSVPHRLGDYFAAIRILPGAANNPASFRLVFQRHPEAGRFWKDLMVTILQQIEAAPQAASLVLDAKGETEPLVSSQAASAS